MRLREFISWTLGKHIYFCYKRLGIRKYNFENNEEKRRNKIIVTTFNRPM